MRSICWGRGRDAMGKEERRRVEKEKSRVERR